MSAGPDSPTRRAATRLARAESGWNAERAGETLPRVRATIRRRKNQRVVATAAALVAFVGAAGYVGLTRAPSADSLSAQNDSPAHPPSSHSAPETDTSFALGDGSRVWPLDGAEVSLVSEAPRETRLRVVRGGARFEVSQRPERRFVVESREVRITVLGTVFEVAQSELVTTLEVFEGRVQVEWPGGETILHAGEEGVFPPPDAEEAAELESSAREHRPRGSRRRASAADEVGELLAAADAARDAGRLSEAARILGRIHTRHRRDPRALAALFTRGRLLLRLRRPGDAQRAFRTVRRTAPQGPLAADALAREAECAFRRQRQGEARRLAEQYLRRYPEGRRVHDVRRFGQLDP